jgi:hypothetical protein
VKNITCFATVTYVQPIFIFKLFDLLVVDALSLDLFNNLEADFGDLFDEGIRGEGPSYRTHKVLTAAIHPKAVVEHTLKCFSSPQGSEKEHGDDFWCFSCQESIKHVGGAGEAGWPLTPGQMRQSPRTQKTKSSTKRRRKKANL